jgi:DNA repair exonuclease SbcCD ATPase subunit
MEYIHDELCDHRIGNGGHDCNCYVSQLEAKDKRIAELEAENKLLKRSIKAQDERNLAATERVGLPPFDCDTPDHLADEIEALRTKLDEAWKEFRELSVRDGKTVAELQTRLGKEHQHAVDLEAKLEAARKELGSECAAASVLLEALAQLDTPNALEQIKKQAWREGFEWSCREQLTDKNAPNATPVDHCPACGEYLHDEMGHECPNASDEHDRAVRQETAKRVRETIWPYIDHDQSIIDSVNDVFRREFGLEG